MKKRLSDEAYDRLKALVTILFPALAAFYATISGIFDFGYEAEVSGVLAASAALLGVGLRLSSARFWENREILKMEE